VLQPQLLNLNAVIANTEKMLGRLIGEDVELIMKLEPDLGLVKADPGQLEQVVLNLAINARDAMPDGGKLMIETANDYLDETYNQEYVNFKSGPYIMLAVSDTGVGMDVETQTHIFEPFFTTKSKGKGTGLGLATVHGIVNQSDGHIWVYSEPKRGSTFKIFLPRVEQVAALPEPEAKSTGLPQGAGTVLLVEDEESVRMIAGRVLRAQGYYVLEAGHGQEALQISAQHAGAIQLLLTDVIMPGGLNGRQLSEQVKLQRPDIKVLYISGYTDSAIAHHGVLEPGLAFLQKPFNPAALAQKVWEVLNS
jgi:CheY-like chemotaxis protein